MPSGYYGATPPEVAARLLAEPRVTGQLDFRSPILDHANGNVLGDPPLVGIPSMYQPFPTTADELLRLLGDGQYPSGWSTSDVLAIYTFDASGNLVDRTGQQPDLVPYYSPMSGRTPTGLRCPLTVGEVERLLQGRWAHADAGRFAAVPAGGTRSWIMLAHAGAERNAANPMIMDTYYSGGTWLWYCGLSNAGAQGYPPTAWGHPYSIAGSAETYLHEFSTRSWCLLALVATYDGTTTRAWCCTPTATGPQVSAAVNAWQDFWFGVPVCRPFGGGGLTGSRQYAYLASIAREVTPEHLRLFMRHASAPKGTSYSREGEIVTSIGATSTVGYTRNQVAIGRHLSLSSGANPGASAAVLDGRELRYIGVYGADVYYYWSESNATKTLADGPSGLRDACAVTALPYGTPPYYGSVHITKSIASYGPSNVPWRLDAWLRATAGTNVLVRLNLLFSGDPGGDEEISAYSGYPTVGGEWQRVGGYVTPTRSGHTTVYVFMRLEDTTQPTVLLQDVTLLRNQTQRQDVWAGLSYYDSPVRRTTWTAGSSSAPWLSYARGRVEVSHILGPISENAALISLGSDGGPQVIVYYSDSGDLYARCRDATGAIAATASVSSGALPSGRRRIAVEWDAAAAWLAIELHDGTEWQRLATATASSWTPGLGGGTVHIGSNASAAWWYTGWIEQIVCYDRARRS